MCWRFTESYGTSGRSCSMGSLRQILVFCTIRIQNEPFVTSTYDEWKYVNDRYGYPEGYVQELGLCRFDQLHDMKVKKNQILIMPTWRMYIRNEISASDHELEAQKFMETDYYRYWDALLKDERLIRYIEENDLQIIFYPHREMHRFLKYFHVDHPKITVASWPEYDVQTLLKESAVLVTDFPVWPWTLPT